jgi:hypothetical protein
MATQQTSHAKEQVVGVFQCVQDGHIPTRQEFVHTVSTMDPLHAVLLLAIGIMYMFFGWKIFKILVIANAALLGAAVGGALGRLSETTPNLPMVTSVAGALLLGVAAWPLMRFAVGVMGAIVGSFIGYSLWMYIAGAVNRPGLEQHAWAGGLLGLIALGLLAFIIFQISVMVFTSFQGTLMCVTAVLALLMRHEEWRLDLENRLLTDVHLLPLIIAVPAVIAFIVQDSYLGGKKKKPADS